MYGASREVFNHVEGNVSHFGYFVASTALFIVLMKSWSA